MLEKKSKHSDNNEFLGKKSPLGKMRECVFNLYGMWIHVKFRCCFFFYFVSVQFVGRNKSSMATKMVSNKLSSFFFVIFSPRPMPNVKKGWQINPNIIWADAWTEYNRISFSHSKKDWTCPYLKNYLLFSCFLFFFFVLVKSYLFAVLSQMVMGIYAQRSMCQSWETRKEEKKVFNFIFTTFSVYFQWRLDYHCVKFIWINWALFKWRTIGIRWKICSYLLIPTHGLNLISFFSWVFFFYLSIERAYIPLENNSTNDTCLYSLTLSWANFFLTYHLTIRRNLTHRYIGKSFTDCCYNARTISNASYNQNTTENWSYSSLFTRSTQIYCTRKGTKHHLIQI